MKRTIFFALSVVLLFAASAQAAQDFAWVNDFNIQAQADPSGFRARLATRFRIGDAQISAVIGNVSSPADAYIVFRLGEMSHRPTDQVLRVRIQDNHIGIVADQSACVANLSARFTIEGGLI